MSSRGELRQNVVTGRWVVVAPARGDRPVEWPEAERETRPGRSEDCPFCPGNEDDLPAVLQELPAEGEPGWLTRVVPNRYPAFAGGPSGDPLPVEAPKGTAGVEEDAPVRPGRTLPARGLQEVLIESPRHDVDLATMSEDHADAVLRTWQERYRLHARALHVSLFRNEGREAGTSLAHAHAQLVATAFPPPGPERRDRRMRRYHAERGACLLCVLPGAEADGDARTVFQGEHLTAWVPWAADSSLEVWIVPNRHAPSFGSLTAEERREAARLLVSLARAYRDRCGDPDFNILLHSSSGQEDDPALHWFLQVRPRLARAAGFELLTAITINESDPVTDASRIREALEGVSASGGRART